MSPPAPREKEGVGGGGCQSEAAPAAAIDKRGGFFSLYLELSLSLTSHGLQIAFSLSRATSLTAIHPLCLWQHNVDHDAWRWGRHFLSGLVCLIFFVAPMDSTSSPDCLSLIDSFREDAAGSACSYLSTYPRGAIWGHCIFCAAGFHCTTGVLGRLDHFFLSCLFLLSFFR